LWYWDGGDGVTPPTAADFTAAPHRLRVSHPSSAQSIVVDGVNGATGFFFGQANVDPMDDEVLHTHLLFTLVDDGGAPVLNPAEGVYLFKTSHHAEVAGPPLLVLDGNPELYWIAGLGVEEEAHEMAVEFVVEEFNLVVPEPTAASLLGLGGIFLLGLKRRRDS
jgi:hypothetical protein